MQVKVHVPIVLIIWSVEDPALLVGHTAEGKRLCLRHRVLVLMGGGGYKQMVSRVGGVGHNLACSPQGRTRSHRVVQGRSGLQLQPITFSVREMSTVLLDFIRKHTCEFINIKSFKTVIFMGSSQKNNHNNLLHNFFSRFKFHLVFQITTHFNL